jgi:hypothetical protein
MSINHQMISHRTRFRIAPRAILLLLLPISRIIRSSSLMMMSSTTIIPADAKSLPGAAELVRIAAASNRTTTTSGKEFYIGFGPIYETSSKQLRLFVSISSTNAQAAQITIEVPGEGNSSLQIEADGSAMYSLPHSIRQANANMQQPLVVKVTSLSSMVTVSGLASRRGSSEAYLALPLEALGTRYIVPSTIGDKVHTIAVAGYIQIITTDAQQATNITISTRVSTSSGSAGTYQLEMGPCMAYLITTSNLNDLGGTEITGSAPFGVMVGNQCVFVPSVGKWC